MILHLLNSFAAAKQNQAANGFSPLDLRRLFLLSDLPRLQRGVQYYAASSDDPSGSPRDAGQFLYADASSLRYTVLNVQGSGSVDSIYFRHRDSIRQHHHCDSMFVQHT